MSLRASIVRNSLSGGRPATVPARLPSAGVRASARLAGTLPDGAGNAADGARDAADGAGTAADATIGVFAQLAMERVAISIVNEVLVTLMLGLRAGPPSAARLPIAASASPGRCRVCGRATAPTPPCAGRPGTPARSGDRRS